MEFSRNSFHSYLLVDFSMGPGNFVHCHPLVTPAHCDFDFGPQSLFPHPP